MSSVNKFKASVKNAEWKQDFRKNDLAEHKRTIESDYFASSMDAAYKSANGAVVRRNPYTGKTDMFVAGTRNVRDWVANVADLALRGKSPWRKSSYNKYSALARKYGVSTTYGHSRGAALLPKNTKRVGVDGAMILSDDPDFYNFKQKQIFDTAIGVRGKKNISYRYRYNPFSAHKVWKGKNKKIVSKKWIH
nr:triacylglycerol lipase [Cressdnaviricota sp.]